MDNNTIEQGKTMAIISYLTIIGSVIALILNNDKKNEFAAFHIRQGLGLCSTYLILGYFIGQFDSWLISIGFWIGFGILFFYGVIMAATGKTQEIPLIGRFYQNFFKNLGK
ncbi:DUF4870 domain-containing protein [Bizionia paragorgiae]|uniref:Chloroplast import component protein (Tic20) n=1 Tax=Bizionia paragorgiae TaxID=283786 RepID=A0A1H4A5V3_BIZPA|nr:hypothetical protein [Bizionia paragorgiae]SEA31287.1 hypothetical protein SAMN04487990_11019 [Bizionia paragorgiae]